MDNPIELLEFSGNRRVPLIMQTELTECGLACLAMVASYHGNKINLTSIRKLQTTNFNGMNLQQMSSVGNYLGLASRALKCPLEEINKLALPCIVHWDLNHFVVLTKVHHKYVLVNDPAFGSRKMSIANFSEHYTGIVLELTPTSNFKKRDQRTKMQIRQLWSKVTGLKSNLVALFSLSVLLQFFALANPYYLQWVVDEVLISYDKSLLTVLAIGFGLLVVLDVMSSGVRSYLVLRLSNMMGMQMGVNLLRHLLRLPMEYFEKRHIGDIVSRFGSLGVIRERLTTGLIETIIDGIMSLTVLIVMLVYSIQLTLIVLCAVFVYAALRLLSYPILKRNSIELIQAEAKEGSNFLENIRGIQTIKLHTSESTRQSLWQNRYAEVINYDIKIGKLNIGFNFANSIIFGFENIIIVYLAALTVMNGGLTVGMLFAFMAYKGQFTNHITNFIEQLIAFRMLKIHVERLSDITMTEIESDLESKIDFDSDNVDGEITLENISFRYSYNEPWILKDCNFTINKGESIAITGRSGCGKSTLMKLILGLLKPTEGRILIDGQDIKNIGLLQYRHFIASVMQNDTLLSGSVMDNITFFDPDADLVKMKECTKLAAIDDDINNMPMGYYSLVGDMGNQFSGGQIQRLLLARALYKQPKILFLDEATSHLDINNELFVGENIKNMNITRVIIAHRKETINQMDRVVIVNDGKIEELGDNNVT